MKKTIQIIVLAMLWPVLNTFAQVQDIIKTGLQIGDKVPDIVINNIINSPFSTARISDFKGKLLILDFWATWCAPCIASIPKLNSLKEQFAGRVQFMPVSYQSQKEVSGFLKRLQIQKGYTISSATDDNELRKLFPHQNLPHYVWIDGNGIVKSITGIEALTAANIEKTLGGVLASSDQKKDLVRAYDYKQALLFNNNGGSKEDLVYHSLFTRFISGIGGGYSVYTDSIRGRKITGRNQSVSTLYKIAYSPLGYFGRNRMLLEVKDTIPLSFTGGRLGDWLKDNTYCYELIVPPSMKTDAFEIMRQDLRKFFKNYTAAVEKRKVKCLVLTRTSKIDKLLSRGSAPVAGFNSQGCQISNKNLDVFTSRLGMLYLQRSDLPVINGTGYQGKVDLNLMADLGSVTSINEALKKYDLQFIEAERDIDMLIISDTKANQ